MYPKHNNMQKTFNYSKRVLTSVFVITGLFGFIGLNATEDHDEIIISNQSGFSDNNGSPRTSNVLIEAYFDTELSYVCASLSNAGASVTVEFINHTTNETADYIIPGSGSSILPISGNAGFWTVTFTLESGDVYYGEFVL